jgi:anion-transporting  ArsA/GET3 family ATPase
MNRQQKRFAEKLRKKSNKELLKDLKKLQPNLNKNVKIVDNEVMDYKDFINSVVITPEMAKELEQYEADERLKSQNTNFNIYNKE